MGEHLVVAHTDEYELAEVGVSREVFQGMKLITSERSMKRDTRYSMA
jgi:hypothetical protein